VLPRCPYAEDGEPEWPEEVEPYEAAIDGLRSEACGLWDDVARARQKLAHLLADGRSDRRFTLVDLVPFQPMVR
jgi:hypothetical protein